MSLKSFLRASPVALLLFSLPIYAASVTAVHNFDKVDDHVYRGGQPTDDGFRYLARLGVKVVLDLREADQRATAEERVVKAAGMKYVNVPMTGLTPTSEAEISRILALLEDASAGPVFVHCRRGADRTGAVIAAYQIDFHHWDNSRALQDAKAHGMAFFQFPRQNFVKAFQPRVVSAKVSPKTVDETSAATLAPAAVGAAAGAQE